jgi:hypothetical protein
LKASILSNDNKFNNEQANFDTKKLEILKFKMIAFVMTYENEMRKMKERMNEVMEENK